MMNYIVSAFAITALFLNLKRPGLSYFVWTATNLWWSLHNIRQLDIAQSVMFVVFAISSAICWWKTV